MGTLDDALAAAGPGSPQTQNQGTLSAALAAAQSGEGISGSKYDIPGSPPRPTGSNPAPQENWWQRNLVAPGEAALQIGSSILANVPAAFRAGATLARDAITGEPANIPQQYAQTRDFFTYHPTTHAAGIIVDAIGNAIDASKLAVPLPELAMLPSASTLSLPEGRASAVGQLGDTLKAAAENEAPPARLSVPAPFSMSSLSPAAQKIPVGVSPLGTATAATSAAAPESTTLTGAASKAAQILINDSGMAADDLSSRLRSAQAATPGSLPPTTGNLVGGKVASLEKALRADADVRDILGDSDVQRTQAQIQNITNRFGGSTEDLQGLKTARSNNSAAWTGDNSNLNNSSLRVDATPIVQQITNTLQSPIGRDSAANAGLKSILGDITGIAGKDGTIDIGNLDAIRQNLRDTIARNATNGIVGSKTDIGLNPIRNAITDQIESAVPGYRNYLAQYASDSRKINTMEAANSFGEWVGGRPLLDPDGTPSISYLQTSKQLQDVLGRQGGVDPQLEQAVNAMHSDMQRGTVVSMSQKQHGSDTLANLSSAGRMQRLVGAGAKATLPGGVFDVGQGIASKVMGPQGLETKQWLAKMMADPRFAADVIDSLKAK